MNYTASNLQAHPEGGRFREVYRSAETVEPKNGTPKSALTHIYFELKKGENSTFHRVEQEEVWNLYRGAGLKLWILNPETNDLSCEELSASANTFCCVIPPGHWQAAEPLDGDVLVGCSVAPGFDFEDFELITHDHPISGILKEQGLDHLI